MHAQVILHLFQQKYFNAMYEEIKTLLPIGVSEQNLTQEERRATNSLKCNQEFIIKEADKGGNVVLWPINEYVQEAMRLHLNMV